MDQALNKCLTARARGIEKAKATKVIAKPANGTAKRKAS